MGTDRKNHPPVIAMTPSEIKLAKGKPVPARLKRGLFQPERLFLVALFLVGFILGPRMISLVHSSDLLAEISERPEYQLTVEGIELSAPPHWVPHDLVPQVWDQAGLADTVSILEPRLVEQLVTAFDEHPWIERVVSLRKEVPARIVVEVEFRKPVGMVETPHGLYPIDQRGILLPPRDFSPAAIQQYPRIKNIRSLPRSTAGYAWGDLTVVASAQVAEALGPHWEEFHLKSIVAPFVQGSNMSLEEMLFTLHTVNGSQILWGRPPGANHPAELPPDKKVGRIAQYQRDFGGLDDIHSPYEIDIRHWQEISRRALPQQYTRKSQETR